MNIDPNKLLVLSAFTPNISSFAELVVENHKEYCAKHGYSYQCITSEFYPNRAPSWSKILFILKALNEKSQDGEPRWDWVFWVDIDAIFTNFTHKLEPFIAELEPTQEMVLAEDAWGLNTGLWFVKNTSWSYQCLVSVWHSDPEPFLRFGLKPPVWVNQARYIAEQTTLWHWLVLRQETSKVAILPYYNLGGYWAEFDTDSYTPRDQAFNPPTANAPLTRRSWRPGDFCLHLAGVPSEKRLPIFREVLETIHKESGEFSEKEVI